MNPITDEWIRKAEADLATSMRESAVQDDPNNDAICFHAQQCAEKYIKAVLTDNGKRFARTHDLEALLELVLPLDSSWEELRPNLIRLTSSAVEVRYPGVFADVADATEAVEIAREVRTRCRSILQLPI